MYSDLFRVERWGFEQRGDLIFVLSRPGPSFAEELLGRLYDGAVYLGRRRGTVHDLDPVSLALQGADDLAVPVFYPLQGGGVFVEFRLWVPVADSVEAGFQRYVQEDGEVRRKGVSIDGADPFGVEF